MLNRKLIKIRSEELDIPYNNLLVGCCLEELIVFISANAKDELWVVGDRCIGLAAYKRMLSDTLILAYTGDEELGVYMRQLSLMVVSYFASLGIRVRTEFSSDGRICFHFTLDHIETPVMVEITKSDADTTFPREKTLRLSLENDRTVHYMQYPIDSRAAALTYDILDKLELLGRMQEYIELYDILRTETIEGRRVKDLLSAKCSGKSGFDASRLDTLRGYGSYTYMKKRFDRASRHANRRDLEWVEVHATVIKFISPIYEAMLSNEIFFGDWIGEIGRFLD